jgi:hypothetical protein
MAVDIEDGRAVGLGLDDVVVPDLVIEGAGLGHHSVFLSRVDIVLVIGGSGEKVRKRKAGAWLPHASEM